MNPWWLFWLCLPPAALADSAGLNKGPKDSDMSPMEA